MRVWKSIVHQRSQPITDLDQVMPDFDSGYLSALDCLRYLSRVSGISIISAVGRGLNDRIMGWIGQTSVIVATMSESCIGGMIDRRVDN